MESANLIKGYGKVQNLEDQYPIITKPPKTRKPLAIGLAISAIILLTVLIALTVISSTNNSTSNKSSLPSSSLSSLQVICNITLYPTTCLSSLSSPDKHDPEAILKNSLHVSITELTTLISSITAIASNDPKASTALQDCKGQFEDAVSRLNDSLAEMDVKKPGEMLLTEMKISDIQTWVSAALTDQQTCLDGLEEVGSKALEEVKGKMERSKEMTSNSLAIVAHMSSLLEKFDMKMH